MVIFHCYCIYFQEISISRVAVRINRSLCVLQLPRKTVSGACSISDVGDCHGYCRFPAFLWQQPLHPRQQESGAASGGWFASSSSSMSEVDTLEDERRWFQRTVYKTSPGSGGSVNAGSSMCYSRREITARPTEIWTEQRVQTPCASAATGQQRPVAGGSRMACYRRETTSNVSCLAEEPSGKYRVLVRHADG